LLVRGIRWRKGASLVLVLCAAVTVAGAAAGPLWGRASQASLLARALQDAPVSERAWVVTATASPLGSFGSSTPPEPRRVAAEVRDEAGLAIGVDGLFDTRTETVSTGRRLIVKPAVPVEVDPPVEEAGTGEAPVPDPPLARLVAREGACEQLALRDGRCPTSTTELLLSDRSADELGVVAGAEVLLPELSEEPPPAGGSAPFPTAYTVVGTYLAEEVDTGSRFWFDTDALEYAPPAVLGGEPVPARLDAAFVLPDLVLSLQSPGVQIQVERVLRPGALDLRNADRVSSELQERVEYIAGTSRTVDAVATVATTVEGTAPGRRLVDGTATFVGLQVVVLGWVVLFGLVAVTVGARDGELALAKLRGVRGLRLGWHALAEPLVLLLVSVPLGFLLAQLAVRALADRVLLPGTPVAVPGSTWAALAATVAGAVVACVLAARRSLRRPVADQLRRSGDPAATGTAGTVASAVLVTLVVVAVVLVLGLGRGAGGALPALLAPVLAGLAAGLVVAQLVRLVVRLGVGRTRGWSLGPYLAVRQVAGQSALTRTTALITAATAVSGFAAGAYVLTAAQRDAQAALDVGAERVAVLAPSTTTDLLNATEQVDPDGRWAMAAVQQTVGRNPLLAVDSARFASAFPVPGGALSSPGGLDPLVPDDLAEPLVVRGDTVTLEIGFSELGRRDLELGVQLRLMTEDGEVVTVALGTIDPGEAQTLTAELPRCQDGCTVLALTLPRVTGVGSATGMVALGSLEVGGERYLFDRREWRSSRVDETVPDSGTTGQLFDVGGQQDGLVLQFVVGPAATPGLVRLDVPSELPAIVAEQTELSLIGTRQLVNGSTLEGGDLPFEVVGRTPTVPRTGAGTVVDLALVSRVEPPRSAGLAFQVWLGPAAPADAVERLEAAGLVVRSVESRAERRGVLDRAEPARAQLLLLGAGAATLFAGVAGVTTALAASARRRAAEASALRAMAVPGRTVRGSAVLEDVLLLLPGVLAGGVCAAVLVHLCRPVLAEITGASVVVARSASAVDVVPSVLLVALGTALLLVPVVLGVTRHGDDETRLRAGT
jgi:hypothetical protein